MYYTGFADEAGEGIDVQIAATKALGWTRIEARTIDGTNLTNVSDACFDEVYGKLQEAGVTINCFGSAIANWGKSVDDPNEPSFEEARRAIPRMKKLGTRMVRIMSYKVLPDRGPADQMVKERIRKLRDLVNLFTDEGLQPVHENCMNYGGMGWPYTLELVAAIPGLKLVFDTGNPVFSDDRSKPEPYPKQSSWEFYDHVKAHIAYVHIKDGIWNAAEKKNAYTFAGEGDGDVRRVVADLLANGYDGGFSMEPHLVVVHHEAATQSPDEVRFQNYVEYGRRFMQLVEDVKPKG
jgi:sugar phosphate isomerase/epimerase